MCAQSLGAAGAESDPGKAQLLYDVISVHPRLFLARLRPVVPAELAPELASTQSVADERVRSLVPDFHRPVRQVVQEVLQALPLHAMVAVYGVELENAERVRKRMEVDLTLPDVGAHLAQHWAHEGVWDRVAHVDEVVYHLEARVLQGTLHSLVGRLLDECVDQLEDILVWLLLDETHRLRKVLAIAERDILYQTLKAELLESGIGDEYVPNDVVALLHKLKVVRFQVLLRLLCCQLVQVKKFVAD